MAILERQNLILDTLRERVKLSVDGSERLPPEELRVKIDEAIEAVSGEFGLALCGQGGFWDFLLTHI